MNNLPERIKKRIFGMSCEQNDVGCSQAGIYKFSSPEETLYLKIEPKLGELDREYRNILWLQGQLSVPRVIDWASERDFNYLLLSEIKGKMVIDDYYLQNPRSAVSVLAEGLRMLWSVDISACPIHNGLDIKLKDAAENIRLNKVDMSDWEETNSGFDSASALLDYLTVNKPESVEASFTQGDYCPANIFGEDAGVTGFIDLGRAGIADIWQDVALCLRSLWHNFNTNEYDGLLLDQLGIPLNKEKLNYYILLDELF